MAKDTHQAVREVCLSFPQAEEYLAHGAPNFRVRGKTFAIYALNHHGDGRIALWLNAPAGAQEHHTGSEPKHFFIPPYVGPRGWLGVRLNSGISWKRIAGLVRQAYEKVAPAPLAMSIGKTIEIRPPKKRLTVRDVDPLRSRHARSVLKSLRRICLAWPETSEALQFGSPVWRAGRRAFALLHAGAAGSAPDPAGGVCKRLQAHFWVGVDAQSLMTTDERYQVPPYMGHNGWIALDVTDGVDWDEVRALALGSYRHFALKRMLSRLK